VIDPVLDIASEATTSDPDILLIAGPTAAGKTSLALRAAERLDAEIINADSMQLYAGMEAITAAPPLEDREAAPHHLFGCADPGERWSVGRWLDAALMEIASVNARGRRAIIVGGTGLYFKALTEGLAPAPDIPEDVRAEVDRLHLAGGVEALRAEAERLDPVSAARVMGDDPQRLRRIIEVAKTSATPLSILQRQTRPGIDSARWRGVILEPDRQALYKRIVLRFEKMVRAGALDEVKSLAKRGLDPDLPAMKAVGVPPLLAFVQGLIGIDEAVEAAVRDTRRLAKRQYTWFRNQHPAWARVRSLDGDEAALELAPVLNAFA